MEYPNDFFDHLDSILVVAFYVALIMGALIVFGAYRKRRRAPAAPVRRITPNERGKLYDAIGDLHEALRLSDRALAWFNKGEFDKAIWYCTEAIRLHPNLADAFNRRGRAWSRKREFEKALADYTEAIRLDRGGVTGEKDPRR